MPFTNAAVRGLVKTAKAAKTHPGRFMLAWALTTLIPQLIARLWAIIHDDEEEYRSQPAYLRDMFFSFKIAPNLWLRIPKNYEMGVLGAGLERAIDYAMGDKDAFQNFAATALRVILPIDEAALAGPWRGLLQSVTNWDFFRQRHIIPPYEQERLLEYRKTDRASRLGQGIQSVIGVDARKIDFLMREMFGYAGQYVTRLSDIGRKRGSFTLKDIGLFATSPGYAARDVQWVMKTARDHGASQRKDYKPFRASLETYFNALTREERDQAAKDLRKIAADLRKKWEKEPPVPRKKGAGRSGW